MTAASALPRETLSTAETIVTTRPESRPDLATALAALASSSGQSYLALIQDYVRLALGPGKIGIRDYIALRLYDRERYSKAEKACFVGAGAGLLLCHEANFRHDWDRLVSNKLSSTGYLASYGLPVIPILALFDRRCRSSGPGTLGTLQDLVGFLQREESYPLFGKPVDCFQSLGSASFAGYDPATGCLRASYGPDVPLAAFAQDVASHYGQGYVFQRRVAPHAAIRAICGDRLATVRVLTILTEAGPKILRACWKIPAGANVADNFWRCGNLLAQLDLAEGAVRRVLCGTGLEQREVVHHPDTGAALVGFRLPCWTELRQLALEAAHVFDQTPLLGWDIAVTPTGPVIVEVNETPDLTLPQIADGRGMLDDEFRLFLAKQRESASSWKRYVREHTKRMLDQR